MKLKTVHILRNWIVASKQLLRALWCLLVYADGQSFLPSTMHVRDGNRSAHVCPVKTLILLTTAATHDDRLRWTMNWKTQEEHSEARRSAGAGETGRAFRSLSNERTEETSRTFFQRIKTILTSEGWGERHSVTPVARNTVHARLWKR